MVAAHGIMPAESVSECCCSPSFELKVGLSDTLQCLPVLDDEPLGL